MKTLFLTAFIFSIAFTVHGQTSFQKTYGGTDFDFGISVQQTTDGGYILFGQTSSFGNGEQDMYLVKTDNQGIEQWHQTYGGTDWEFGISAQQTADGGFILCGAYSGLGNDSLALIKTDQVGNIVWNKRFSGTTDREVGQFVQQTSDGGYIAVGFAEIGITEHIYMVKTDVNGNEQWSKVHISAGRENAVGVMQTSDSGYAMIGETSSTGFGGRDMFLVKTNINGDTTWTKTFGTSLDEIGRSLYITSDNGFILLGYEYFAGGNLYLVKTDSLGNAQWNKYYGGTGWDMGNSVQQTSDGGFILAGRKENPVSGTNDMYCIKTDNVGLVEWEYVYPKGVLSDANSVQQTSDGGFILLGSTTDTVGGFGSDMYLVKTNSLGQISIYNNITPTLNIFTYPNPFTEYTIIEINDTEKREFSLSLFNCQGQIIRSINHITSGKTRIERDDIASGLYIFQLSVGKQLVAAGKLIIE